jgi:tetratricopeptide (TPR) repeat protein
MNSRIQHLIQHPFEVQLSDVALLQDEIEKYPYFSTLRTLLLFGLKEFDHSSYQDELKKTSIYCPSRVALYHYLQKEKQESTEQELIVEETVPFKETEELFVDSVEETMVETTVEIPTEEENVEEMISTEDSSLEKEIDVKLEANQQNSTEIQEEEKEEEILKKSAIETDNSAFTFSEWLNLPKKLEIEPSEPTSVVKTPSEREIKFQLIEEFIEKAPKITPPSRDHSPNIVIEKPSNTEEYSDLMTETLAQIYTEQKKYEKAIRAYKILLIKYPEKEEYFMEKIEYIDYLMNSK